jgi:kynurenine formamidase
LYSGWSDHWGSEKYFRDFPVLSAEAAIWISELDMKGIGVDMISVDPVDATKMQNHQIFFEYNMVIIENLTHLSFLENRTFTFSCLPMKFETADGAPTRAVAIL